MFEIIGLNKSTFRMDLIAYASNATEKQKILEQEAERYIYIIAKKLRNRG